MLLSTHAHNFARTLCRACVSVPCMCMCSFFAPTHIYTCLYLTRTSILTYLRLFIHIYIICISTHVTYQRPRQRSVRTNGASAGARYSEDLSGGAPKGPEWQPWKNITNSERITIQSSSRSGSLRFNRFLPVRCARVRIL